jgi:hypothetical protein
MEREINGVPMRLVHSDGKCKDGSIDTPLDADGLCPVCGFHPDMQSTEYRPINRTPS